MLFLPPAHGHAINSQEPGMVRLLPETLPTAWLELALYLGKDFDWTELHGQDAFVQAERAQCATDQAFYETSQRYLYHLTQYFLEGWKRPGYAWLMQILSQHPAATVLDYGCGIGSDGLWFMENNIAVDFADYDNPSRQYPAWRLAHRVGHRAQIYDLDADIPRHGIVWCMDVLEHLPPAQHWPFLQNLATLGEIVVMNLVDDRTADGLVHYPVDVEGLTTALRATWPVTAQDWWQQANGSKVRFLVYGDAMVPEPAGNQNGQAYHATVGV
jgi:hypothetical protein